MKVTLRLSRSILSLLWGDFDLSRITTKMIEKYKMQRLEAVMPSTLNRELNTVKNMLSKAVEWGYLRESPAKATKWIKTIKGAVRFLSREEANGFLEACKESKTHISTLSSFWHSTRECDEGRFSGCDGKTWTLGGQGFKWSADKKATPKNYESRTVPMNHIVLRMP